MELTDRLRLVITKVMKNECLKYDYNVIKQDEKDTTYRHSMQEHRFIASQVFSDFSNDLIVHHIDNNHNNNNIDNLKLMTQAEHNHIHCENFFKKNNTICYATGYTTASKRYVVPNRSEEFCNMTSKIRKNYIENNYEKFKESTKNNGKTTSYIVNGGVIKNITYLGKQNVYDIVNVRDNHNFIANGFVVSNTGKSSFAIMFAKLWCKIIDIRFNPKKHIVYSNAQIVHAIDTLPMFHPIVCDEAIDFASAQNWNKRENKDLKIKLGKIRTKHMLFILCWPWKINRLDKIYFESYITYWIDLYTRGKGALFVKDKNPYNNPWKIDEFKDIGSFTEFSTEQDIQKLYSKHPNFWSLIFCKKPSAEFYARYLKVRESNVYNNSDVLDSTEQGDIYRAFIIKSFEDVYMKGSTKAFKRLQRHLQEMYKYTILEKDLKNIFDDANMLVEKMLEKQGIELERKEQQMITDGISQ
jgi:hypothetical protein